MRLFQLRYPLILFCLLAIISQLQAQVPHPKDVLGFTPGDDRKLANYEQLTDYFEQLTASSQRVQMKQIGESVLGNPMHLLFISSEENLSKLEEYRSVSEQLAKAEIDENTASQLAADGKAIVWIDGGLHATEIAGSQMTPLLAYRVATEESAEMQKIRDNVIMILMPVMNPDGLDIVVNWYKQNLGTPYETTRPPWLYHFYVGHDNNRDWFMNNMPESEAVTRVLYNEWYPQIVYNHHQTGPSWTRIFIPPFADPVNPHIHPGVTTGVNMVGTAMANRFALKHMPGAVSGVIYSMWWNGGMRTVPYFHNMIGILTETSHASATPRFYDPDSIPSAIAARRGAGHPTNGTNIFYPYPWKGGKSTFSQPVNYMITATMATLRLAADVREQFLNNIYQMGRDAIEKGESGGPYAYVIPKDQWNQGEEIALAKVLRLGGVEILRSTAGFTAGGKEYEAGSMVIKTAQSFRPYILDLLEKQEYPTRRRTPNGPPEPPYDLAGWTLPMQMGVQVDRIEEAFKLEAEDMSFEALVPEEGTLPSRAGFGYIFSHKSNASIHAVNKLLNAGRTVYIAESSISVKDAEFPAGSFVLEGKSDELLETIATDKGVSFTALTKKPSGLKTLKTPRIGIYKSWVASMDEGWTRWLLNEYEFQLDTLHDSEIRNMDLSDYDVIIMPHQSRTAIVQGHRKGRMPGAYTGGIGLEGSLALKQYVENGGRIVALDAATDFAIKEFALPVRNLVEGVSSSRFFIPGSLIRINIDTADPLAYGMENEAAASFVRSRAFGISRLTRKAEGGMTEIDQAPIPEVDIIATYAEKDLLMSGWAMGEQRYLAKKAAVMRVPLGQGDVVLFGFRPQFRGQPRGTYKLFFNSLLNTGLD